ncbi:MAG: S49 family peptidase, partial [Phocaeicola sp.]
MNDLTYLRNAILSQNLFITSEGLTSLVMDLFPTSTQSMLDYKPATYKEQVQSLVQLAQQTASDDSIAVTTLFNDESLQQGTIAYHPIFGFITASSYWRFSTKQFEKDLLAAESNPAISCHFIHINSPGGEAWYMDRISE